MTQTANMQVAIIGAGPAGLFAAQALAVRGYNIAIFNRDIKPGGLAEYGIFLDKHKMKEGLRSQFRQILALDNVNYFGNITIGQYGCVGISDLLGWGFSAVLVACGAQGTKTLNMPGENLKGVYHAKDLVFHYNRLPPYSLQAYPIGKKVAIVGAGNVMTDIAHYLIKHRNVAEITVIVRRGPAEVKFDKKELLPIISYLDQADFNSEIERISARMIAIGQNPEDAKNHILEALGKACPKEKDTRLFLRFLYSPKEVIGDSTDSVSSLKLEENTLEIKEGVVVARGLENSIQMKVDNVIFAIGDRVTTDLGLPMKQNEIRKTEKPKYPVEGESFEVGDSLTGEPVKGIFVAGWSRNASTGLVGIARKDGVSAASAIAEHLVSLDAITGVSLNDIQRRLSLSACDIVTKENLKVLETEEKRQAEIKGVEEYKFSTNEEMLQVIGITNE
ncbi:MAG: hypothetical protein FD147_1578 [Chloroflexi bacterium]|nr:MAG: hypothetical protein FD147_1578 [Chloroflexota bacterium]